MEGKGRGAVKNIGRFDKGTKKMGKTVAGADYLGLAGFELPQCFL